MSDTIIEVVKSYQDYLFSTYGKWYSDRYEEQAKTNLVGAKAEAATFAWLYWNDIEVKIGETPKKGGVDFICCAPNGSEFIVEVTAISSDKVDKVSKFPKPDQSGSFRLITQQLKIAVEGKLKQIDQYNTPRIVVVASDHRAADILLQRFSLE